MPGAPFGRARREFADRLAEIVNGKKLPTVLMADLNFPEKAFQGDKMKVNRKKQDPALKDDAQEAMRKDYQRFGLCRRYFYVFLYGHHLVALLATMWPTGGTSSSA